MPMPKGGILAFEMEPEGGSGRRKQREEDDPRRDAAEALLAAFKSGSATKLLDALDVVMDLREVPEELSIDDDLEDFDA